MILSYLGNRDSCPGIACITFLQFFPGAALWEGRPYPTYSSTLSTTFIFRVLLFGKDVHIPHIPLLFQLPLSSGCCPLGRTSISHIFLYSFNYLYLPGAAVWEGRPYPTYSSTLSTTFISCLSTIISCSFHFIPVFSTDISLHNLSISDFIFLFFFYLSFLKLPWPVSTQHICKLLSNAKARVGVYRGYRC